MYNGSSVVDYVISSENARSQIHSLIVEQLNYFSDHCPIRVKMDCSIPINQLLTTGAFSKAPKRFKWNASCDPSNFCSRQSKEEIEREIDAICSMSCDSGADVYHCNEMLVNLYHKLAENTLTSCTQVIKKRRNKPGNRHEPWFTEDLLKEKRRLNKHNRWLTKHPENSKLRLKLFQLNKQHKKHVRRKKEEFIECLNKDIEDGKNISWNGFKELKRHKQNNQSLDLFDMTNFISFFKSLYQTQPKTCLTPDEMEINPQLQDNISSALNVDITAEELEECIQKLKTNKAVSEDLISNDFLKNSSSNMCRALLKVFNACLHNGTYPWNTSYVTPLHKSGSIYDPNNYRAIAVGSSLGKLFSSILLGRLLSFREAHAPNPKNQLGFCAGGQTSDHILTLSTCIQKYIRHRKERLYTCFVDFRKAFDTVSRQGLVYKLDKLGIKGRFLSVLKHIYSNSSVRIKLLQKLSDKIDILVGTEQGHPMSPELFKVYIHDLSLELDKALNELNVPVLNGNKITHLLYADDLVLFALDESSLKSLLLRLEDFCSAWGLTVNMKKTVVMVFNYQGRLLNCSSSFKYGSVPIQAARNYTYLGIVFNLYGSFKDAIESLRKKALRSYFGMKKLIDWKYLKRSSIIKLIDALLVPVLT